MISQTHWRLAVMFDTPGGNVAALEEGLKRASAAIRAVSRGHGIRIGVADRHPDLDGMTETGRVHGWRTVDGAIEVTVANESKADMAGICRSLPPLLADVADLASAEVMAGPMFPMVPVRSGQAFLSLCFRRDPRITSQQFQDWWLKQHSQIAIPVMGPELLAYDQVHVEMAATADVAAAFGAPCVEYDAYDNLTSADRQAFLHSSGADPAGMGRVAEDELGHIDETSRRFSIMTEVI